MDVLRFYVLFNSNSVISGRSEGNNERVCIEPHLLRKDFLLRGCDPGTARSAGQRYRLSTYGECLEMLFECSL